MHIEAYAICIHGAYSSTTTSAVAFAILPFEHARVRARTHTTAVEQLCVRLSSLRFRHASLRAPHCRRCCSSRMVRIDTIDAQHKHAHARTRTCTHARTHARHASRFIVADRSESKRTLVSSLAASEGDVVRSSAVAVGASDACTARLWIDGFVSHAHCFLMRQPWARSRSTSRCAGCGRLSTNTARARLLFSTAISVDADGESRGDRCPDAPIIMVP